MPSDTKPEEIIAHKSNSHSSRKNAPSENQSPKLCIQKLTGDDQLQVTDQLVHFPKLSVQNQHSRKLTVPNSRNVTILSKNTRNNWSNPSNWLIYTGQTYLKWMKHKLVGDKFLTQMEYWSTPSVTILSLLQHLSSTWLFIQLKYTMVRKAANTYQSGLMIIRDPAKIDLVAHSNWLEITPINYKGGTPSTYV